MKLLITQMSLCHLHHTLNLLETTEIIIMSIELTGLEIKHLAESAGLEVADCNDDDILEGSHRTTAQLSITTT